MTSYNLNDLNQFLCEFVQTRVCVQFHASKKLSLALSAKVSNFFICLIRQSDKPAVVFNNYRGLLNVNVSHLSLTPLITLISLAPINYGVDK
ncbi:MAG: hypothetical protein QM504_17780 [Pseudomonadota bacterium]